MQSFIFSLSPGMGLLDNWLPFLKKIKKKNLPLNMLLPNPKTINQVLDETNILNQLSFDLFDGIYISSLTQGLILINSFDELRVFFCKYSLLLKLSELSKKLIGSTLATILVKTFDRYLTKRYVVKENPVKCGVLLYDVLEENKKYFQDTESLFNFKYKFSMMHGLNILSQHDAIESIHPDKLDAVFMFSNKELGYYKKLLPKKNYFKAVGIIKHSSSWINQILKIDQNNTKFQNNYVVLFTRNPSTYLPIKNLKIALKDIQSILIEKYNLKLIIKFHPKELNQYLHIYKDIFHKEKQGINWDISFAHPYTLLANCKFSMTFYSGICIDALRFKKINIEYLNLDNIKDAELRFNYDANGKKVFSYAHQNLTLNVQNMAQLDFEVAKILDNKKSCPNYDKFFSNPDNALKTLEESIGNILGK